MNSVAIACFALALIAQLPISFPKNISNQSPTRRLTELDHLLELRARMEVSMRFDNYTDDSFWSAEIQKILKLNQECGIAVIPQINYLIACERDRQKLKREYQERAASANIASQTLIAMPLLMWLIANSIGVDVLNFVKSGFGILSIICGISLTLVSRLLIKRIGRIALQSPQIKRFKPVSQNLAAFGVFIAIFLIQTSFQGLAIATLSGCVLHFFWHRIPVRNPSEVRYFRQAKQHVQIMLLAGIVETGAPWTKALGYLDDEEAKVLTGRLEMGVDAIQTFGNSNNWQDIGKVISFSIEKGSKIADDLRLLADEYRRDVFSYRVNRIERIAGRLIIPVNLLQIPAFIFLGLIPLVAPLIIESFSAFHI